MGTIATVFAVGVVLYVMVGALVGLAFVTFGITTLQSAPVTLGARVLLLPAAGALWPLVLSRWFKSRHPR